MLPDRINMIFLSATTPNTEEFCNWIGRTKRRNVRSVDVYLSVCHSACLSACLSVYLPVNLCVCLSVCQSIYLSICPCSDMQLRISTWPELGSICFTVLQLLDSWSVCCPILLFNLLCIYLSVHLIVCLSFCLCVCLFIHLNDYAAVCLSVCLCVCLFLHIFECEYLSATPVVSQSIFHDPCEVLRSQNISHP